MAAAAIQIGLPLNMPAKPQAETTASAITPLGFRGFTRVEIIGEEAGVQTLRWTSTRGRLQPALETVRFE
jgi:hypothetical protein